MNAETNTTTETRTFARVDRASGEVEYLECRADGNIVLTEAEYLALTEAN